MRKRPGTAPPLGNHACLSGGTDSHGGTSAHGLGTERWQLAAAAGKAAATTEAGLSDDNARRIGAVSGWRAATLAHHEARRASSALRISLPHLDGQLLSLVAHRGAGEPLAELKDLRFDRVSAARRLAIHERVRTPPQRDRIGRWVTQTTAEERRGFASIARARSCENSASRVRSDRRGLTGLRFANNPSPLRSPSGPCSRRG